MKKNQLFTAVSLVLLISSQSALAELHVTNYDSGYANATGTITFDDWGYTGPSGVDANTWEVAGGFNSSLLGQVQRVETVAPDWLTPDGSTDYVMPESSKTIDNIRDPLAPWTYQDASNDGQVNFYEWIYTTPQSNFNNMQIDTNGNYHVAKEDMAFGFYDEFAYNDVTNDAAIDTTGMTAAEIAAAKQDETLKTDLSFQPYAVSDAKGWCGSVMGSHPMAVEPMYGQLTFDFAFDQCGFGTACEDEFGVVNPNRNTQLVPGFEMRSYGSIEVNVQKASTTQHFVSHAVVNNTNPETGEVDPDFASKVSFHGAGVVPTGAWVSKDSYMVDEFGQVMIDGAGYPVKKNLANGTWDVTLVEEGSVDAQWHINAFAGYAFLLRADGMRILEKVDMSYYDDASSLPEIAFDENGNMINIKGEVLVDLSAVPVPAAVWLFGSGFIALMGMARRKAS